VERKIPGSEYTIDCTFSEGKVVEKVDKAGQPMEKTVELKGKVYLLDNNNLSLFAFLAAAMPREKGKTVGFKVFHVSSMQVLLMEFTVADRERITIGGKERECWRFDVVLAGMGLQLYVDDQGRLLRDVEQNGAMIVELMEN